MSEAKRQEFEAKVDAVLDATKEFAEGRVRGDWFMRGLDDKLRAAVDELLAWEVGVSTVGAK